MLPSTKDRLIKLSIEYSLPANLREDAKKLLKKPNQEKAGLLIRIARTAPRN